MGKVLKVLGVIFLVLIVGVAALMIWSHQKGEATQEEFFQAVLSGDVDRVLDRFHPELRAEIDPPVLKAWMGAIQEHLGAFDGLAGDEFSTKASTENGVDVVESSGKVEFAKGTAQSNLRLIDDRIVAFHVTSEALPEQWFTGLEDDAFYEARATGFLAKLLGGDADGARAMMHENLRAKFDPEALEAGIARLRARLGDVGEITPEGAAFKQEPPQELVLRLRIVGANEALTGSVRFVFDKLRAHLIGFDVPAK